MEKATNKEKTIGIQTTIQRSLGTGSRSTKNTGGVAPLHGGSQKPTMK
jgi:hypothetical protein